MSDIFRDFNQARDAILHGTNNALPNPHHPKCALITWAETAREVKSLGVLPPPPPLCTCGASTFGLRLEDDR